MARLQSPCGADQPFVPNGTLEDVSWLKIPQRYPLRPKPPPHRSRARGDHWEVFARKSIAYSTTLALARGAHRSAARFSIWTHFEERKLHLVVYRQWTSPKQRRVIR